MSESVIQVNNISKMYHIGETLRYDTLRDLIAGVGLRMANKLIRGRRPLSQGVKNNNTIWALKDVSFSIKKGEVVGIIGRNGAGKSTLLKILSRITEPTEGKALIRGRASSLLEVGTGFHPELTGRENISLNGAILGMSMREIKKKFDEIVAFAEIERFIDTPVKRYSSGMYVRLAFAVAAHLEPEILLVDEVLAVGDYAFQKKCLGKMGEIGREGRTVLLVSHNMSSIMNLCQRTILLSAGKVIANGYTSDVIQQYIASTPDTRAEIIWQNPATAPGNNKVRFHSVRLITEDGKVSQEHDIQKDIIIQMQWWNLIEGTRLCSGLNLRDQYGTVILGTNNMPSATFQPDPWWNEPHPVGLFESFCRIPGNLLNEATYSIDAIVSSNICHTEVILENVLSFHVLDMGVMRKEHPGNWHGQIRIRLDWNTKRIGPNVKDSLLI